MKEIEIAGIKFRVNDNYTAKLWEWNNKHIIYFNDPRISRRNPASAPGSYDLITRSLHLNPRLGKFWTIVGNTISHKVAGEEISVIGERK